MKKISKKKLDKLIELTAASVIAPETQSVYIAHADCPDAAEYLREKAMALGFADAVIGTIGPVIGACIGPDAVGIWSFGREVTVKI
jgi:fatty acid-binding protein DegV